MKQKWELAFENYQNEQNLVVELGQSDLLLVYVSNIAEMSISPLLEIAKISVNGNTIFL